ncbi:MAG TPA: PEGA domain-containing protein [Vicinamibacterales bacterium]|nr:PEGA domain-containing protein [Vicinamibacterales bacterium]
MALKLPGAGSPANGSIKVLTVDITPERVDDAAEAVRELVGRLPNHPGLLPVIDVSVADGRLVLVTPPVTGDSLDAALKLYGPAAVDDALPRLRQLAGALDAAAKAGLHHGALHPRDIIVSPDDTRVAGVGVADALARVGVTVPLDPRYTAPETAAARGSSLAADQFSLAVIAHEWMFSGAVTPADGFLAVPALAGIDARAMQRALDTATAPDPAARFSGCLPFVSALERSAGATPGLEIAWAEEAEAEALPLGGDAGFPGLAGSVFNDAPAPPSRRQFGLPALVVMLIAGIGIGAAGMRLLDSPLPGSTEDTSPDSSGSAVAQTPAAPPGPTEVIDLPVTPPRDDIASPTPDAAQAARTDAGLLIHSTPAGAIVTIDGVARGTTPIAVRGLELGARRVSVSRPGYQAAERQVTLTEARPSRTLDVDLVPVARASAPTAATAPAARATATTGSLVIDSRPAGASVTLDGRPVGSTPVTLTGLAPGRRTVRIERAGYRTVTATVDVKAGEQARVGARLEGGQYEE